MSGLEFRMVREDGMVVLQERETRQTFAVTPETLRQWVSFTKGPRRLRLTNIVADPEVDGGYLVTFQGEPGKYKVSYMDGPIPGVSYSHELTLLLGCGHPMGTTKAANVAFTQAVGRFHRGERIEYPVDVPIGYAELR